MSDRRALREFITLQRGQSYQGSQVGEPGPYLLGLGTIERNGGFRSDILRTYGGECPEAIRLSPGDLYVSLKDVTHAADLLGAVARVPEALGPGRLTQDTTRLDVDEREIDRCFLYWLLRGPEYRAYCRTRGTGTTNLDLSREDFLSYEFVLPTMNQQRAIAEVLGALDDKISANNRLAAVADELSTATLRAALAPGSQRLADLASVTMGSSPPGTSYNEEGEGTPFFQGVRDFGFRSPARRVWTTAPVRFAQTGETLVSVRAPVGKVNVAREELCIGRGLASVRSRDDRPWTLFHLLREASDVWARYEAEGTVFGSINREQLAAVRLPLVADPQRVEAALSILELPIAAALGENVTLAETRDTLLPALMSGKLRVRDAAQLVSALT